MNVSKGNHTWRWYCGGVRERGRKGWGTLYVVAQFDVLWDDGLFLIAIINHIPYDPHLLAFAVTPVPEHGNMILADSAVYIHLVTMCSLSLSLHSRVFCCFRDVIGSIIKLHYSSVPTPLFLFCRVTLASCSVHEMFWANLEVKGSRRVLKMGCGSNPSR